MPAVRISPELRHSAALRLVPPGSGNPQDAARKLVAGANAAGIDLGLIFGTVQPAARGRPAWVRHAVLLVRGSGRTAMVFQGSPLSDENEQDHAERVACLQAACDDLGGQTELTPEGTTRPAVAVAQSLPDPNEQLAIAAMTDAGFSRVGDLSYMRRPLTGTDRGSAGTRGLPSGVTLRAMTTARVGSPDHDSLVTALNASYADTLDCPELCGMRETPDVVQSHIATGTFDPTLWTLVFQGGEPVGCALFSPVPENRSAELVYLGLGPSARGLGLGRTLLLRGLSLVAKQTRSTEVLCAVDKRNAPALKLYQRAGFRVFSERVALIRRLHSEPENA